ncbi:MAG: TIGR02452 family protein [Ruminococcus sp.]|nr:TIGR02452 family protein [Ruminococcus sp.]
MNNIELAKQAVKITSARCYDLDGNTVQLPPVDFDYAEVYSPDDGAELLKEDISELFGDKLCRISVTNKDSFQAAAAFDYPLVMNFANAHVAGGGFKLGANAQEEALCRCSTLYASISSSKAAEMYRYNNTHLSAVESDYMLLSPEVCVFRDTESGLLKEPFRAAVITVPAPNKRGAAMLAGEKKIAAAMTRRIRIMLRIAAKNKFRSLVLGAWGCGAFGNQPENVAQYFKTVIIGEEYGKCFDEICFAIYGVPDGMNITAFTDVFDNRN